MNHKATRKGCEDKGVLSFAWLRVLSRFMVACLLAVGTCTPARAQGRARAGAQHDKDETMRAEVGALLTRAVAALQAGGLDEAEPLLRRALAVAPANADAHSLLGALLDQRGHTSAAERAYRTALTLNPRHVAARANLGVLLARTGRTDEAVRAFEEVLKLAPEHPQATYNLGLQYAARGQYERAASILERARAYQPDNVAVLAQLALALYELKHLDEAETTLASAAALAPADADVLYARGLVSAARGQRDAALALWAQALAARENFPAANFMLGEELRKDGRLVEARAYYERALAQDPARLVHYVRLGGVLLLLRLPDLALDVFTRAAARFPSVAEAHYFVGVAARWRGTYDVAEAAFRKSLALRPADPDTLAQLGFIVGERGNFAEAERLLRHALDLNNRHFYANYDLGRLLVKLKRYDEALPRLQHGATLKPHNASVHYQQFIALSRLKRKDEAARELAIFKQLAEEARKSGRPDEADIENPAEPPTDAPPPEHKP